MPLAQGVDENHTRKSIDPQEDSAGALAKRFILEIIWGITNLMGKSNDVVFIYEIQWYIYLYMNKGIRYTNLIGKSHCFFFMYDIFVCLYTYIYIYTYEHIGYSNVIQMICEKIALKGVKHLFSF